MILDAVVQGVRADGVRDGDRLPLATLAGMLIGLMRVSHNRLAREVSSFYVEIVRGVPMLVILYYIAFVGAPALVAGVNALGRPAAADADPGGPGAGRWPSCRCAT